MGVYRITRTNSKRHKFVLSLIPHMPLLFLVPVIGKLDDEGILRGREEFRGVSCVFDLGIRLTAGKECR